MSHLVAALAAGFLATTQAAYAQRAISHLRPWFVDPRTRLEPRFEGAGHAAARGRGTPAGIMDLVPLAECVRALSFLRDSLADVDVTAIDGWMGEALAWCRTDRQALLAQDSDDHRASAHLLITSALARSLRLEADLEDSRTRFRKVILRHQVRPDGVFPQEVTTDLPFRNSLMNFDLLAGACQLLHSPFSPVWNTELIDGVGMHSAAAYLYPPVVQPGQWKYPADVVGFRELPGRRPGMLFAGRAFNRPEYVAAWLNAPTGDPSVALDASFPIRQPALWTARAPHGL